MSRRLHLGSVIPPGLVVDHIEAGAGLAITARPKTASARCPRCDGVSSRVHSRYTRTLSDLPVAGRRVVITVSVRRFRCVGPECRTKVFAERLEPDLAAAYARRTGRLETIVHHLGLALGGRPAESFARRLMVPASRDTMLRAVRRRAQRPAEALNVVGIAPARPAVASSRPRSAGLATHEPDQSHPWAPGRVRPRLPKGCGPLSSACAGGALRGGAVADGASNLRSPARRVGRPGGAA